MFFLGEMPQKWTVSIVTPDLQVAFLKRLASGNLQVISTPKDAILFPTCELATQMNLVELKGRGKVQEIQIDDNVLHYTPYALIKHVNGELLYMHYSEIGSYTFQKGMRGACIFQEHQADMFLNTIFANDPKIVKLELQTGENFTIETKATQSETDKFVKNAKKRAKKTRQKANARMREQCQGPELGDEPVVAPI